LADDRGFREVQMGSRRGAGALLALAAALSAPALVARAEEPAAEKAAEAEQATAQQRFEQMEKDVRASQQKVYDEYRAAAAKEQEAAKAEGRDAVLPAFDMQAALRPHVEKFQAAAKEYAGTDDAVRFLTWLVFYDRGGDAGTAATGTLIETHLESPEVGRFVGAVPYFTEQMGAENARSALDTVIEKNPDADVRATALISRGNMTKESDKDAARADYSKAAETAADPKVAARARGIVTEMDHLQIGMVAPDIEGEDLDGVAFKLSDYRGKVVVLDFWGDW
jgi:hypothetical protein